MTRAAGLSSAALRALALAVDDDLPIRALVRALGQGGSAELLLTVDDAHWVDKASLLALLVIARAGSPATRIVLRRRQDPGRAAA